MNPRTHLPSLSQPLVGLLAVLWLAPAEAATLGETISAALALSEQSRLTAATRAESQALAAQAGSLLAEDPSLRLKTLSDRFNSNDGAFENEAMVDLPLWLPGQPAARRAQAQALSAQADSDAHWRRWEMAGRVREAAWAAALAEGRVKQADQALASARALEQAMDRRARAGELAPMDVALAQQDSLTRELEREDARLAFTQAMQAFRQLSGLDDLPQPLRETLPETRALDESHPALLRATAMTGQARAGRERARRDRFGQPLLSVGVKQARDARGMSTDEALQLEVSLPWSLQRLHAPDLAAAERELTSAEVDQLQARRAVQQALTEAELAWRGSGEALAVAERQQQTSARTLKLTERAFSLGELDLNRLLRAREQARLADLTLALRRLERERAAARLNQALGVVPE
ncbi:TolC family protein [Thiorhodovibrio frisius]|uniref:Outer membrane protein n=1 Tax=Thiorhodovibrio frisius TaxID=631362 RepID=H8Z371_9GAMM|nr:TolC family protein [Thiorhodovibrio frisius]EIC21779.1 outer membrane protein [Thiorhodovibrio frisius]WPL21746.1 Outer membrane efflux protein [Thiorhodovibrio frisius]